MTTSVVTKLEILCIPFWISFILALWAVVVAKLVISGILSSISLILVLHTPFLTTFFYQLYHLFF